MKYFCARLKFCGVFGTESRKGNVWEQSIKRSWQPFHKVWPLYVGSAGSSGVQHYQSCYIFFCKTKAKWSIRWLMKFTAKSSLSPGNSQLQQGASSIAPLQGWCKKLCRWHHSKLKLPQCLKRNYSSETNILSFVCIAFAMLSLSYSVSEVVSVIITGLVKFRPLLIWVEYCLFLAVALLKICTFWFSRAINYLLVKRKGKWVNAYQFACHFFPILSQICG